MGIVDEILDRFDFRKTRAAMSAIGHRWTRYQLDGAAKIYFLPTEADLRMAALAVVMRALADPLSWHHEGGFVCWQDDGRLWLTYAPEIAVLQVAQSSGR